MDSIKNQLSIATDEFIRAFDEYKDFKEIPDDFKDMEHGDKVFNDLSRAVREVERLRGEYDEQTGFNEAQMIVHDFSVRVDTDDKGNMGLTELRVLAKEIPDIVSNIDDELSQRTLPNLVGITKGSTILLGDFKVIDRDDIKSDIDLKRVKNIVSKAVKMIGKEDADVVAESNRFARENDLSGEQVYRLVKGLSKITDGKSPVSEISFSNSRDYNEAISLKKTGWKKQNEYFKNELKKLHNDDEPLYLEGLVHSVESWEETHAFRIYTEEKPRGCTINFNPEKFNNSEIAELMDNYVTIHRVKIGRRWFLDEIVSINKREE